MRTLKTTQMGQPWSSTSTLAPTLSMHNRQLTKIQHELVPQTYNLGKISTAYEKLQANIALGFFSIFQFLAARKNCHLY